MIPVDSIICGDNCDVLGTFPRECIDLVVTSPPYDDLRTYGGHSWDFYGVAWQLKRVLKPGGVIVWVVADQTKDGSETGTSMRQALHFQALGLRLHDTMTYDKNSSSYPASRNGNRYTQIWEFMFVLSKGKPTTVNLLVDKPNKWAGVPSFDGKIPPVPEFSPRTNRWSYVTSFDESFGHPAIFPEALARDHILTWSAEGDVVLDPFNGSGTTTKAAREHGRRFIGIDVNEGYCSSARKRIEQLLLFP